MLEIHLEIDEDGEKYPGYFLLPILQSLPMPDQSRWKPTAREAWEAAKGTATLIGEQREAGERT